MKSSFSFPLHPILHHAIFLQEDGDAPLKSLSLLKKKGRGEKAVICSAALLRRFPIVNRSGSAAPFPFILLLEACCLCLTEDRTTNFPATLHWSNTWELPLAWWEKKSKGGRKRNDRKMEKRDEV